MRVQQLPGRAILHCVWGRVCGWLTDLAIDPVTHRVAALQVRSAADGQVRWLEPFPVEWRARHPWLRECDPEDWTAIDFQPEWITLEAVVDAECDVLTWQITA
jgi:hypothetical protein